MSTLEYAANPQTNGAATTIIDCDIKTLYYGTFKAVRDTKIPIEKGHVTAFIGPSGCGKSTVLRCINRMNDLVRGFRLEGHVHFGGQDVYSPSIDPVAVRRHIGMVFQQPNPFAMSIYNNVAYGLKLNHFKGNREERVEQALRAPLFGMKSKTSSRPAACRFPAASSNGCASPGRSPPSRDVLLMDEPCSALDPIATRRIEELMTELKKKYTIVIVTHNLQQAKRVADKTGFLYVDTTEGGRTGYLVELGETKQIFEDPRQKYTQEYIRGEFS